MAIKSHPACSLNDHLQGESQQSHDNTFIAVHWQGAKPHGNRLPMVVAAGGG
jgi:hypothetical protein